MSIFCNRRMAQLTLLLLVFFFSSSCEKEQITPTDQVAVSSSVNMRSNGNTTYAVSLYRAGVPAEIYEIDACTGDMTGLVVQVNGGGFPVENVVGITRQQGMIGYNPEPFYLVSLGDNSGVPGLPAVFSNSVWEIDITSGNLINQFSATPSGLMDLCWGDFTFSYWDPQAIWDPISNQWIGCQVPYFVGLLGVEEDPVNNHYQMGFFQGPSYSNISYTSLAIDGIPITEEVQGLSWVRDVNSGCNINLPQEDALGWFDQSGTYHASGISLYVSTYDPNNQFYKIYTLRFDYNNTNGVTLGAKVDPNNSGIPVATPTLASHFALGWISDEWTQQPANMLMGGNLHQFPMANTFSQQFDNCNPMMQPGQPTPNSIPVEVADFISVPYFF